jgi:hypothetical protein
MMVLCVILKFTEIKIFVYIINMAAGKLHRVSRGRRTRRFTRRKKNTLTKRVNRLENNVERKFDTRICDPTSPGIPNSIEMTNNTGSAATQYDLQIRDISPDINQGVKDTDRIGDQCTLKTMKFQAVVSYQPTTSLPATGKIGNGDVAHCRVLVVQDNYPTYSGPSASGTGLPTLAHNPLYWNHVLGVNPVSGATETPSQLLAPYKYDLITRGKRCTILADRKFTLVAGTSRSVKELSFMKRWLSKKLKYLAGGDAPIDKHFNILFISNRKTGEAPHIYYQCQYTYTDE